MSEQRQFRGAILIDDPLKAGDTRLDAKRKSVNKRWDEIIKSRCNSPVPVIAIISRLHEDEFKWND